MGGRCCGSRWLARQERSCQDTRSKEQQTAQTFLPEFKYRHRRRVHRQLDTGKRSRLDYTVEESCEMCSDKAVAPMRHTPCACCGFFFCGDCVGKRRTLPQLRITERVMVCIGCTQLMIEWEQDPPSIERQLREHRDREKALFASTAVSSPPPRE